MYMKDRYTLYSERLCTCTIFHCDCKIQGDAGPRYRTLNCKRSAGWQGREGCLTSDMTRRLVPCCRKFGCGCSIVFARSSTLELVPTTGHPHGASQDDSRV